MRGLDDLDLFARHAMTVARDDEPRELTAEPVILDRLGHRCRGLACADDDGASLRRLRQKRRHALVRHGPRDGGVEHLAKKLDRVSHVLKLTPQRKTQRRKRPQIQPMRYCGGTCLMLPLLKNRGSKLRFWFFFAPLR